jgi:hypothetical protein
LPRRGRATPQSASTSQRRRISCDELDQISLSRGTGIVDDADQIARPLTIIANARRRNRFRRQSQMRRRIHSRNCFHSKKFSEMGTVMERAVLEHDPEKHALGPRPDGWVPVFPRDKREAFARRSCSNKKIERDDDSKKSHPAPGRMIARPDRSTAIHVARATASNVPASP